MYSHTRSASVYCTRSKRYIYNCDKTIDNFTKDASGLDLDQVGELGVHDTAPPGKDEDSLNEANKVGEPFG